MTDGDYEGMNIPQLFDALEVASTAEERALIAAELEERGRRVDLSVYEGPIASAAPRPAETFRIPQIPLREDEPWRRRERIWIGTARIVLLVYAAVFAAAWLRWFGENGGYASGAIGVIAARGFFELFRGAAQDARSHLRVAWVILAGFVVVDATRLGFMDHDDPWLLAARAAVGFLAVLVVHRAIRAVETIRDHERWGGELDPD